MQKINNLNNIDLAITKFNQELYLNPHNPDTYNNLACLYYKLNKLDEAIYNYKRSIYLNPHNWQAHYNLANCYTKKNSISDAISHYKFSLELFPKNINAIQNLGMLLITIEDFAAALPYLEQAYLEDPSNQDNLEFIENLSNCYLQLGNIIKATELLEHAVNLNISGASTQRESVHHNLAILYLRANNYVQAERYFKIVLTINPNNQTAKHMLFAITQQNPSQAPQEYISNLFDQYAAYYNKHLKETLQYKLPEKLRSLYAKHSNNIVVQNTLDLGCGTGLCGIYFRDATVNLFGVDLSTNMLLHARSIGAYDLLIQANLQATNIFQHNYFDLILAADVLPYMGDLENLFLNIQNINNNKFLFNIELLVNLNPNLNYKLQQTGRYVHSKAYIEQLAKNHNFLILECLPEIIRLQNNIPINGLIFLLIKNNTY